MRTKTKVFRFSIVVAAVITVALNACTQEKNARIEEQLAPAADISPSTLSGSYLAGRFAQRRQDWDAAQGYLNEVLAHDRGNDILLQKTFLLTLGAADFARSKDLAGKILNAHPADEISLIFLAADALARDDYAGARAHLEKLPEDGLGAYTKPLLTAWALAGEGRFDDALNYLKSRADEDDPAYRLHAGLIEEMRGDAKAAAAHYTVAMANGLTLHSAVILSDFFTRAGKPEVAGAINAGLSKAYPFNPFVSALSRPGRKPDAHGPLRAADGAGYALHELATMLYEKRAYDSARIYNSLVRMLLPSSGFARLMAGDIEALRKQYGAAVAHFEAIPQGAPLYWLSRMRVAEVYEISGQSTRALETLDVLTREDTTRTEAYISIGDIHRSHEDFGRALEAYDAAIRSVGHLTPDHWAVVYARGMALERTNNWTMAEKDLLQALEFQPDNPQILNFIGYSWAEKGVNLDKALEYIGRAVDLKPDDGYILDSYGWAHYRVGRFDAAVKWMERAVEKVPDDATILDHLGDAYWQVGRRTEARFQWRRAGELSKDAAFRTALEGKISHGMPAGQPPAHGQKEAKL